MLSPRRPAVLKVDWFLLKKNLAKLILLSPNFKTKKKSLNRCRVLLQICADPFTKAEISQNQPPVLNLHCQHKRWPSTALWLQTLQTQRHHHRQWTNRRHPSTGHYATRPRGRCFPKRYMVENMRIKIWPRNQCQNTWDQRWMKVAQIFRGVAYCTY